MQLDFRSLDRAPPANYLSFNETLPYFSLGINQFLSQAQQLDVSGAFAQSDIDRDGLLSKNEWYTVRLFPNPRSVQERHTLPPSRRPESRRLFRRFSGFLLVSRSDRRPSRFDQQLRSTSMSDVAAHFGSGSQGG